MSVLLRVCTIHLRRYYIFIILFNLCVLYMISVLINYNKIKPTSPTPLAANQILSINPNNYDNLSRDIKSTGNHSRKSKIFDNNFVIPNIPSESELRLKWMREKVERLSRNVKKSNNFKLKYIRPAKIPNYNVHTFYYAWYRNLKVDKQWSHWDHDYLPNWKREDKKTYATSMHQPPHDIGSNYYPFLDCYSSRNKSVIDVHMKQIRDVGIGVVIVSWTPPGFKDSPDDLFIQLLNAAQKHQLHVAIHIEPYPGRNPINLLKHIRYIKLNYVSHPAFHKTTTDGKQLPVYYIYDSYLTSATEWRELLSVHGNISVRGTQYDGFFVGLLVEMKHRYEIKKSNFDGFYTYFACNGYSYGSTWKNWRKLKAFSKQHNLLFIPSVGPGYMDIAVRPWNTRNTRHRRHGHYYDVAWRSALNTQPLTISITSFNEWHEGTQIEPAKSKKTPEYSYFDYEPEGPFYYLNLTRWWVHQFTNSTH